MGTVTVGSDRQKPTSHASALRNWGFLPGAAEVGFFRSYHDRNLRGKPRGSARGSSEQAGTACGATSVASGQLACEAQQGQPHQPLPTEMLSGE